MADRIDGLLLICPVIIADIKKRNIPLHVVLVEDNKLLSKLSPSETEYFHSSIVVQNERNFERYRDEILSGIKIANIDFLRTIKKNAYEFSFDVDKINKKFDKPTLIVLGRQDSGTGYKDAWRILENYPRATFAVLDKAGHNLQIEQAEVFNSLVHEWITRVEEA
jgi:pimeloyl-ACP methyl ester carboxylesterase